MNNSEILAQLIGINHETIEKYLKIYHKIESDKPPRYTWESKFNFLSKKIMNDFLNKEEIWTFIIACAYAYSGKEGIQQLTSILCQIPLSEIHNCYEKAYIEYMVKTPRKGIQGDALGNSVIDLALGCIDITKKRMIHYKPDNAVNDWICLVEMKLFDDIQATSGKNPIRNQLVRIIEDAITFQKHGHNIFPNKVHVTLVTPALFQEETESRLYGIKFEKYHNTSQNTVDVNSILTDISKTRMNKRNEPKWKYPDNIKDRLEINLSLHWVTFEDIIEGIPENEIKNPIQNLLEEIECLIKNIQVN